MLIAVDEKTTIQCTFCRDFTISLFHDLQINNILHLSFGMLP